MVKLCLLVVAVLTLDPQAVKGLTGAVDAGAGEFPHHVFLIKGNRHFCSGSLISAKYVLSAGTCVVIAKETNERVTAVIGTNIIHSGGITYNIAGQLFRPGFNRRWFNDISIFRLVSNGMLPCGTTIARIPTRNEFFTGMSVTVTAAGSSEIGGPTSTILQKLSIEIMSQDNCSESITQALYHDSNICGTSPNNSGLCLWDNGGPVVYKGFIIAIAIGSTSPCGGNLPDVFTNVFSHRGWIEQNSN